VLVALGLKKALGEVDEPLHDVPAFALCAGAALYLLGHVAIRLRSVGSFNRPRLLTAAILLALIPYANSVDALAAVLTVAAVMVALVTYEVIAWAPRRAELRSAAHH
jgi:low temperature requirement protein LtrA